MTTIENLINDVIEKVRNLIEFIENQFKSYYERNLFDKVEELQQSLAALEQSKSEPEPTPEQIKEVEDFFDIKHLDHPHPDKPERVCVCCKKPIPYEPKESNCCDECWLTEGKGFDKPERGEETLDVILSEVSGVPLPLIKDRTYFYFDRPWIDKAVERYSSLKDAKIKELEERNKITKGAIAESLRYLKRLKYEANDEAVRWNLIEVDKAIKMLNKTMERIPLPVPPESETNK